MFVPKDSHVTLSEALKLVQPTVSLEDMLVVGAIRGAFATVADKFIEIVWFEKVSKLEIA